jgi:hypothetical protein
VVAEFEADTHRSKTMELLQLKQVGTIEDYRRQFEHLVYHIRLYDNSLSNIMLTAQFLMGLKEELRSQVELQLSDSVAKSAIVASIQEKLLEKVNKKYNKPYTSKNQGGYNKTDVKSVVTPNELWKVRQLREHRRTHGLCFKCGDTYSPGHKCSSTTQEGVTGQLSVLTAHAADGGEILSDELLSALELNVADQEVEYFLSIHAIAGTQSNKVIHLKALVNNQVLSVLIDSGSSHTFLNTAVMH